MSATAIQKRVKRGRLFRLHRCVYATHPPPYDKHQRWLAAVYASEPDTLLSDWCAADLMGIWEGASLPPHVTNRSGACRKIEGIEVHRREIDPRDRAVRHGIPCTSAARTIVDLAGALRMDELEAMVMAADSLGILNRRRLEELAADGSRRPGSARLRELLSDDPIEVRSRNEGRMMAICHDFRVARPLVNHRIDTAGCTFYADFCWPDARLIVEADSWRWHGGRAASERDRDRDQLLSIAGWRVVHFTRDQILHGRAETGSRLVALTAG